MSCLPGIRRWLSGPAGRPKNRGQPPPLPSSANPAAGGPGADTCSAVGPLSFRRIVDIPFDACLAALENWQHTGQDREPHPGHGLLRGPIDRDRDTGTCHIQVCLPRRPPRKPLLMRLDIDRLSAAHTALELIPCQRARPTAGYFRAGHHLLDSLTHALRAHARNTTTTPATPRPADIPPPQPAPQASSYNGNTVRATPAKPY
jgi:hypothetical protein